MKKTLVALAVLTAAGSANAGINLYDADGVKVDMSGAAEVQLYNNFDKSEDPTIRLDDGDLAFNATIAINEKLNVVSGMAFAYESRDVTNDELWVGFSGDFGALTLGRQLLISDDSGIGKDYELGTEQVDFGQTEGDRVAKYVFDNGSFYAGVSHEVEANDSTTITDGRIGYRVANFDVRGYYYTGERIGLEGLESFKDANGTTVIVKPGKAGDDIDGFNLEAEYVMDAFAFAASYGQIEYKDSATGVKQKDLDLYEINGSYTMDKTTFALGYARIENSIGDTDADNVYANVTQQLHSNVKVYGELGWLDDSKGTDYDFGYVAGMEVKF